MFGQSASRWNRCRYSTNVVRPDGSSGNIYFHCGSQKALQGVGVGDNPSIVKEELFGSQKPAGINNEGLGLGKEPLGGRAGLAPCL